MGKSSMGKLMGLWTRCISAHMEMAATHFCCFPCFLHTAQALDFSKSSPASSILAFSLMHLTPRPHSRRLGLKPGTWDSQSTAPSEPKKKKKRNSPTDQSAVLSSAPCRPPSAEYPAAQNHLSIWISPKRNWGEKVRVCIAKGAGLTLHLTPVCSPIKLLPMELFCAATSAANNSAVGGGMSPDSS